MGSVSKRHGPAAASTTVDLPLRLRPTTTRGYRRTMFSRRRKAPIAAYMGDRGHAPVATTAAGSLYRVKRLPPRYEDSPRDTFDARIAEALKPGGAVLDIGGGRNPCVSPSKRPQLCLYVGLDASLDELQAAPSESYDEIFAGNVEVYRPELENRFDVVVSWQVLEHVRSMSASLANIRRYLRPGGTFVAQLSGRFAVYAALNAVVPRRSGVWAMKKLLHRNPETVFPAYYDQCWHSALVRLGTDWESFDVQSVYCSAIYFNFSKSLQRAYLMYENWTASHRLDNLAPHYLIVGVR